MTRASGIPIGTQRGFIAGAFLFLCTFAPAHAQQIEPDLAPIEQAIRRGEYGNVHAVSVMHGSERVADWYFTGRDNRRGHADVQTVRFTPNTLHDIRSVTKSIVALLFGVARDDGVFPDLDEPVLNYFPEYADLRTPERMRIRLRDLLSMSSGLEWDESGVPYTLRDPNTGETILNPANSEIAMDLAPDRYRYILSRPIAATPGERFTYSGGDVALLAEVVARATHTPIDIYARERLFRPLGIRRFEWLRDQRGVPIAASGLRLRPRDMARIGALVAHNGRWRDRQIIATDWITAATTRQAQVSDDPNCGAQMGYLWWLFNVCRGGEITSLIFASGNGGQKIWISRSFDVVVATTAGAYDDAQADRTDNVASAVFNAFASPAPAR